MLINLLFYRYERWENARIAQNLSNLNVLAWNGLFLAVKPEFTNKGYASIFFVDFLNIMAQLSKNPSKNLNKRPLRKRSENIKNNKTVKELKIPKFLHIFSLLSRHALPTNTQTTQTFSKTSNTPKGGEVKQKKNKLPILIILSHQQRSSNFYRNNGCFCASKVPFQTENHDKLFDVDVLAVDLFGSKRYGKIDSEWKHDCKDMCDSEYYNLNFNTNIAC